MKKQLLITAFYLFAGCWLLVNAQSRVVRISELADPENYTRWVDADGYLLIEEFATVPFQQNLFREGVQVMEGWPVSFSGASNRGGIFANLDEDPELEVIYNISSKTYALNIDGTDVTGWPKQVASTAEYDAPAFGDIDGDGYEEIVISCVQPGTQNSGKIYAFEKDGTTVTGFPVTPPGGPTRTPVLADLDGNGTLEIVVELRSYPDGKVCVFQGDGSIMNGWPQNMDYIPASAPAVGDINGDGIPEIVAESYYQVWAFHTDGTVVEGFPYIPAGTGRVFSYSSPVLADFDNDGFREIVVGDHNLSSGNGAIHVIKSDGTIYPGWPRFTQQWIYGPASVADIDGDGSLDILVGDQVLSGTPASKVYGWKQDGTNLPGFPIGPIWSVNSQIIVADLDGDLLPELMFDDNTGSGIINGYNHDGTMMEGWPINVNGSSFFCNPFVFDVEGNGTLNISANSYDSNSLKTFLYLWDTDVTFNQELAILPVLGYNVMHTGVYGDNHIPTVSVNENGDLRMFDMTCSPNPCLDETSVNFYSENAGNVQLLVFDSRGILVKDFSYETSGSGTHKLNLDVSGLKPGVYFVNAFYDDSKTGYCRIVKL